jgi:hypothetical protein
MTSAVLDFNEYRSEVVRLLRADGYAAESACRLVRRYRYDLEIYHGAGKTAIAAVEAVIQWDEAGDTDVAE